MYNQIRFLPDEVESHIVCEFTENLEQFFLPNIHSIKQASRWRYYLDYGLRFLKIRRHLGFVVEKAKKHHAQILHSHFGNVGWENIGVVKRGGLKHAATFYGLDVNLLPNLDPRWIKRFQSLFAEVDLILCEGPHMAKCIANLGCDMSKIRVHHLGVPIDEILFKPRIWNPGEPYRILIASSFREKKGIPYALEALGRINREIPLEACIIGDANKEEKSRSEKQRILEAIEKNNLRGKIRMLGYQPHSVFFEEAYRSHVFLAPSVTSSDGDTEGGAPVSIIELMASGMPVVSTRHCDIPEVVKHGVTGLLAEERDVEGLVENLRWLLNHPGRWTEMVSAGRKHVETEFNARVQGEKLGRIYRELAG